jgi:predicted nucleic acid-binding protein
LPPSRIDAVVCDAGPLIALGRLDLLGLLPRLFRQAYVPEAVLAECVARPALLDAQRIRSACDSGQLIVRAATPIAARSLGIGERSAIGAALEISAALLADDRAARRQALALGIIVIGSLGVLVQARRSNLLPQVAPLIEVLRSSGYRLSDDAARAALTAAGEACR